MGWMFFDEKKTLIGDLGMYFLFLNISCAALVCILEDSLEDEVRLVRVLVSSLVLWTVPTYASSYEL